MLLGRHVPREKDLALRNIACFLLLAVVLLFWVARVDRNRTAKTRRTVPTGCSRLANPEPNLAV